MAMCIYNNCSSVQKPFSSLAFFALPKDSRRKLWIENSGNTQLATLSESARRVVCEKHFSPNCLRKQFHRTILSRDAVPEKWCVEPIPIEIYENSPEETHLEENLITIDEQSDDEEANKEGEDWRSEYETSLVDQAEDIDLDFEVGDSVGSPQPIESHFSNHEDAASQDFVNETDHNQQNDEDENNLLEILAPDNPSPNQYPPFLDEVEIETLNREKRKITSADGRSGKIPKLSNKQPQDEPRKSAQSQNIAYDVMVSSSTTKSDESGSGSLQGINEEDKYFALALVGILQRISPQKRAFAKVNILKYLTELEYGVEASIK